MTKSRLRRLVADGDPPIGGDPSSLAAFAPGQNRFNTAAHPRRGIHISDNHDKISTLGHGIARQVLLHQSPADLIEIGALWSHV